MTLNAITVVIRHESDYTAKGIVNQLQLFVEQGLLSTFLDVVVPTGTTTVDADLGCRVIREGEILPDTLLNSVARVGDFGVLRMGLLNASEDSESISSDISNVVQGIHNWLHQLLGSDVNVVDARIGIRAFGESLPHQDFFPVTSNGNILVIPQDRITDGGVARPIARTDEIGGGHSLELHGAVEVASLLGLWQSMSVSPIDGLRPMVAGSATPRIMFSQSRVRALLGPGLPMDRVAPMDEELPAPRDYFSVADSQFAAETISDLVYPAGLCFVAEPEPDFYSYHSGLRQLIPEFFREIGRTIVGIPRVAVRGIHDELNAIAGEGLQNAIGTDSWVQILWAGRDGEKVGNSITQEQISQVMKAVEIQYRRELLSPLDAASWSLIVKSVLSSIDGSTDWAKERQNLFGNEKLLLLKKENIGSPDLDLSEVLSQLALNVRINEPEMRETSTLDDGALDESENLNEQSVDSVDEHSEIPTDAEPAERISLPMFSGGLFAKIASRFQSEAQSAHNDVLLRAERIRQLYSQLEVKDTSGVSPIFNVAMASAFAVLVFVIGTCTGLNGVISFEDASSAVQDSLWLSMSSVFIVGSILLLVIGGKRTWQARALLSSVFVSFYIGIMVVFFNELRDIANDFGDNVWPAVALGIATLGLVVLAVIRSVASTNRLRNRLGRAFGCVAALYLLIGLSVWQARTDSFIGRQDDEFRSRLFWVSSITSLMLIASCLIFVAIVVIRERNRLNSIAKSIEWARKEIVSSADAERRLSAAAVQWITTAAVLNRIINMPLGKLSSSDIEIPENISEDDAILKFDAARLLLTDVGDTAFTASLRNNFVERGWLVRQYEKLVREYQVRLAARTSNSIEAVENRRPEGDPEVIRLDELLSGKSRAERYRFLASVYGGEFDDSLIQLPENFDLREVYQPILNDRSAYDLSGAQFEGQSIMEFMSQICPTRQPRLPVGLVGRPFTSKDPEQEMKVFLWWPSEIVGDIDSPLNSVENHETSVRRGGPVTTSIAMMAVRVDISGLFLYSECQNRPEDVAVITISVHESDLGATNL